MNHFNALKIFEKKKRKIFIIDFMYDRLAGRKLLVHCISEHEHYGNIAITVVASLEELFFIFFPLRSALILTSFVFFLSFSFLRSHFILFFPTFLWNIEKERKCISQTRRYAKNVYKQKMRIVLKMKKNVGGY